MLTNFDLVTIFHDRMDKPFGPWPPTKGIVNLQWRLIDEEYHEVFKELYTYNDGANLEVQKQISKSRLAKELADLLYVVYDAACSFDIDIDRVFAEVHRSNMSKLVDGKPLKREDGKVLKGPNYTPPNLEFVDG